MKIALIQFDAIWQNIPKNLQEATKQIKQASKDNCDLVIFPEMFHTGFCMDTKLTTSQTSDIISTLSNLAKQNSINIIAGLAKKENDKYHNIAITIDKKGKLISQYIKNYSFSLGHEEKYYTPNNKQSIFKIDTTPSSTFICYDLRFPELFRKVAQDIKIIFVIANWPSGRTEQWNALLRARAVENQCFVVGVNRVGRDGNNLKYSGSSCVYSPIGEEILKMDQNTIYQSVDIDISKVAKIRKIFPFLKDMK